MVDSVHCLTIGQPVGQLNFGQPGQTIRADHGEVVCLGGIFPGAQVGPAVVAEHGNHETRDWD